MSDNNRPTQHNGPPDWAAHLIIYELNPRTFAPPHGAGNGHGSGTFRTLTARIPYLADLGVNCIWLAGYCAATDHFYGIWSVYATIRPDSFDPELGTDRDFKTLIETCHSHDIKVILDVISHGVVEESSLITEHPTWFSGRSWNMIDYDYSNNEFREWWVQLWVDYVLRYGIDGFRVDISLQDHILWDLICARAADSGHPVVVMPENGRYHFGQRDTVGFSCDVAADWRADYLPISTVQVSCHDNGWLSPPGNYYSVRGRRSLFGYSALLSYRVPVFFAGEEFDAGTHPLPRLTRGLYGAGGPGGWLYGSIVDPGEVQEDWVKAAMLKDVHRMIMIRRNNSDIINANHLAGNMYALECHPKLPFVPYIRVSESGSAIVVIANEADETRRLEIEIPFEKIGSSKGRYQIRDLWGDKEEIVVKGHSSYRLNVELPADRRPGGGLAVYRIDPC